MSQFSHPTSSIRTQVQAHRMVWFGAVLALLATAAVVMILAIDNDTSTSSVAEPVTPARASDGYATAASSRSIAGQEVRPSESRIAASVGGAGEVRPTGGPDESSVAASLSKSPSQPRHAGPDEAATARAISGR